MRLARIDTLRAAKAIAIARTAKNRIHGTLVEVCGMVFSRAGKYPGQNNSMQAVPRYKVKRWPE